MKKLIALAIIMISLCTCKSLAQGITVRSNLAADAIGIVNAGVDFTLTDQISASVSVLGGKTYLPFFNKTMLMGGQIEGRYWFAHQPYEDFFLGLQLTPVIYSFTKDDIEKKGFAFPLGFNFGYSWPINEKLNIEASYGAGIMGYSQFGNGIDDGTINGNSNNKKYNIDFKTTNICVGVTYILK